MMVTITLNLDGRTVPLCVPAGTTLLAALQQADASFSVPCGGNHTCGKCFVTASGALSPVTESEAAFLREKEPGTRLACFTSALGDCAVYAGASQRQNTLTDFHPAARGGAPLFAPGKYGFAVDIGTTTIAAYLYGGESAAPLAVLGEYNRQQQFGADVMTRIAHANEQTPAPLCRTITEQLASLFARLCEMAGVSPADAQSAVLTGNTVMLHLLAGLEVRSLAQVPFTLVTDFGDFYALPLGVFSHLRCYLPRCISAYVGADITCGILASDLLQLPGNILFADIGTNGEMALKTKDRLLCCSTAAGPAFEGAGITHGCGAVRGAINAVRITDGAIAYDTLENAPATGICGSGVIDAIAAFIRLGLVNDRGQIAKELNKALPFPDTAICLTQMDIRQFQLAKGAIRAGMDCLMQEAGLSYDALSEIILCGGFGSYINTQAAETLGMIPPGCARKTRAIGNAAGSGAAMALLGSDALTALDDIAKTAQCVELSSTPFFSQHFISCMNFPALSPDDAGFVTA